MLRGGDISARRPADTTTNRCKSSQVFSTCSSLLCAPVVLGSQPVSECTHTIQWKQNSSDRSLNSLLCQNQSYAPSKSTYRISSTTQAQLTVRPPTSNRLWTDVALFCSADRPRSGYPAVWHSEAGHGGNRTLP